MTEKRFKITDDGIVDTVRLKQYKKIKSSDNILDSISFTHLIDVVNLLNELNNENEKLKQYIYDNLDEDICRVCSYQYLEKSKMDKYYVAKCKKGYDNCSKGTVIHCIDFKFKELQELTEKLIEGD